MLHRGKTGCNPQNPHVSLWQNPASSHPRPNIFTAPIYPKRHALRQNLSFLFNVRNKFGCQNNKSANCARQKRRVRGASDIDATRPRHAALPHNHCAQAGDFSMSSTGYSAGQLTFRSQNPPRAALTRPAVHHRCTGCARAVHARCTTQTPCFYAVNAWIRP